MKVGIITFHRAQNYGAVLQCFALSKILQKLGNDVEVIDYFPKYLKEEYGIFPSFDWSNLLLWGKKTVRAFQSLNKSLFRSAKFKKFSKSRLPLSKTQYNETTNSINDYDVIVFGSDQIWNPLLTNGIDKIFSGFFHSNETKLVSYAASTAPSILTEEYSNLFKRIIDKFSLISTREDKFTTYLNSIEPNIATTVLDPVLLLETQEWRELAIPPKEDNYLLIYTVPQSPLVLQHAEFIAEKLGLKIIELTSKIRRGSNRNTVQCASPEEFLGYFLNASYIVTTSFHGTAFSIKFNKQFSNIKIGSGVDERAQNLLISLNLLDRAISKQDSGIYNKIIDYNEINKVLDGLVSQSLSFLNKSLIS